MLAMGRHKSRMSIPQVKTARCQYIWCSKPDCGNRYDTRHPTGAGNVINGKRWTGVKRRLGSGHTALPVCGRCRGLQINKKDAFTSEGLGEELLPYPESKSPLEIAAAHGRDLGDGGGQPLLYAAECGSLDACILLIKNGASVAAKGGKTCLHAASEGGHLYVCCFLLKHGVDVDGRDDDGCSALDIARRKGYTAVAAMLMEIMDKKVAQISDQENKRKRDALSMPPTPIYDSVVAIIENVAYAARMETECRDRDREKREYEEKLHRLETEKAAVEQRLELKRTQFERTVSQLEQEKVSAAAKLGIEHRESKRVRRELETTIERLKQEMATSDEKLEQKNEDCRVVVQQLMHEKTLAQAELKEVSCDRDREQRELEVTVERLEREKIMSEAKLDKFELENAELRIIVKQLEQREELARYKLTQVLKPHVVVKQEPLA